MTQSLMLYSFLAYLRLNVYGSYSTSLLRFIHQFQPTLANFQAMNPTMIPNTKPVNTSVG